MIVEFPTADSDGGSFGWQNNALAYDDDIATRAVLTVGAGAGVHSFSDWIILDTWGTDYVGEAKNLLIISLGGALGKIIATASGGTATTTVLYEVDRGAGFVTEASWQAQAVTSGTDEIVIPHTYKIPLGQSDDLTNVRFRCTVSYSGTAGGDSTDVTGMQLREVYAQVGGSTDVAPGLLLC